MSLVQLTFSVILPAGPILRGDPAGGNQYLPGTLGEQPHLSPHCPYPPSFFLVFVVAEAPGGGGLYAGSLLEGRKGELQDLCG